MLFDSADLTARVTWHNLLIECMTCSQQDRPNLSPYQTTMYNCIIMMSMYSTEMTRCIFRPNHRDHHLWEIPPGMMESTLPLVSLCMTVLTASLFWGVCRIALSLSQAARSKNDVSFRTLTHPNRPKRCKKDRVTSKTQHNMLHRKYLGSRTFHAQNQKKTASFFHLWFWRNG